MFNDEKNQLISNITLKSISIYSFINFMDIPHIHARPLNNYSYGTTFPISQIAPQIISATSHFREPFGAFHQRTICNCLKTQLLFSNQEIGKIVNRLLNYLQSCEKIDVLKLCITCLVFSGNIIIS